MHYNFVNTDRHGSKKTVSARTYRMAKRKSQISTGLTGTAATGTEATTNVEVEAKNGTQGGETHTCEPHVTWEK